MPWDDNGGDDGQHKHNIMGNDRIQSLVSRALTADAAPYGGRTRFLDDGAVAATGAIDSALLSSYK